MVGASVRPVSSLMIFRFFYYEDVSGLIAQINHSSILCRGGSDS